MNTHASKTAVIIAGPTAVGKTAIAVQLAKYFDTEIISADSRQCYKELSIGVARPSRQELSEVKHHFIASHSVKDEINAAFFEKFATERAEEIFRQKDILIVVGGTGLYIKAFCEGLDDIPETDPVVRNNVRKQYKERGLNWLQEELKNKDPLYYSRGEIKNPHRMMRALEVKESTGYSVLEFRKKEKARRNFNILKIGLHLQKEELQRNIAERVDKMMEAGLLNEVEQLTTYKEYNALQTVGYRELFEYLAGNADLSSAVGSIKKNTRLYAKRQMTWFRKDPEICWFTPDGYSDIVNSIRAALK